MENKGSQTQFVDATNRFYTLIPHDFGMGKIKLLDTAEAIKTKTEMLDNLLEIEVAYNLLKGADGGEDPIDAHYKKLKCAMEVRTLEGMNIWYLSLISLTVKSMFAT